MSLNPMSLNNAALDIATGIAGGLVATWVTDRAGKLLWAATPVEEREREPDEMKESSSKVAARKLVEHCPVPATEENIERTKTTVHYGLGLTWATLYTALRRSTDMRPLTAGMATGIALSLVVDETLCPLLDITPPNDAFPASAHIRGFVTHAIWGLSVAAVAETLNLALGNQTGKTFNAAGNRRSVVEHPRNGRSA